MSTSVVLAYSGGVDTSICIHWLESIKGFKVITLVANLGQPRYLEAVGEKAASLGATTVYIKDLRLRYIKDYIWPTLKANAKYEGKYLLAMALSKPPLAEALVELAQEENCQYIAHGSRGSGNDYIRLENAIRTLAPQLKILTPLKELGLKTISEDIKYARKHHLPVESERLSLFNVEQTLWGVNIQLGSLESIRQKTAWHDEAELLRHTYLMTTPPPEASDKPLEIEIGFQKGEPVSFNRKKMVPYKLIEILNKIGGHHAIGRVDMIENKISGEKTREIYEAPAATILYFAHQALEEIILDKTLLHFKELLSIKYGEIVYEGLWFTPLRSALDKFFLDIQQKVTGRVKLRLYKGNLSVLKRKAC